ncbi:MAG: tetratricopeptide repeat protein, partial [Planctomycetales bacterium]
YQSTLRLEPTHAKAHGNMGGILQGHGRIKEALAHYEQALQLEPDSVEAQNNLAWLLATCHDTSVRNGQRAVDLAERAAIQAGIRAGHASGRLCRSGELRHSCEVAAKGNRASCRTAKGGPRKKTPTLPCGPAIPRSAYRLIHIQSPVVNPHDYSTAEGFP